MSGTSDVTLDQDHILSRQAGTVRTRHNGDSDAIGQDRLHVTGGLFDCDPRRLQTLRIHHCDLVFPKTLGADERSLRVIGRRKDKRHLLRESVGGMVPALWHTLSLS